MPGHNLYNQARANRQGFRDVTPTAVAELRGALHIVDVRQPGEYTGELGHVPGAVLVPLGTLAAAMPTWDPAAPIVLVCRSGGRSGNAAAQLVAAGFSQVMNMTGGMLAYQAAGLPTER